MEMLTAASAAVITEDPSHNFSNSLDSQSRPSYRPFPCVAQVAWMYHWRRISNRSDRLDQYDG